MNRTVQALFSVMTLALIGLYGRSIQASAPAWLCLVALGMIYLAMIWIRQTWWTRTRYALSVSSMIVLVSLLVLSSQSRGDIPGALLLAPLVLLLAREQQAHRRFVLGLAIVTLAAMALLLPSNTLAWTVLPVVAALYMSVRAINIYKAAYRLSQQNAEELAATLRELQETYAALQEATVRSMRYAALAERTRLARDIHDGLGHQLTSLIVQLQALEVMLPTEPDQASKAIPEMLQVARKAMAEVHRAVRTWREDEASDGLVALRGLVSEYAALGPVRPEFRQEGELSAWSVELSVNLYHILQEALTNISRHAQATAASILVEEREGQVILTVADDGTYTGDVPLRPGYGLSGIRERAQGLGGTFQIIQNQPHGLRLQVTLPIAKTLAAPTVLQTNGSRPNG